jgi:hypothetical protein
MKKIIIIAVIIIAVLNIVWFIFIKKPSFFSKFFTQKIEEPIKLPETNPFKTETNPFSNSYKNPFSS